MTTLLGVLRAAGCSVATDGAGHARAWVLMSACARAILVAAGEREALDIADGVWMGVAL